MRIQWLRGVAVLATLSLAGCRGSTEVPAGPAEDTETHLSYKVHFDVADWLKLPRAELAKLCVERGQTAAHQQAEARNSPAALDLLPNVHVPTTVPVLNQAAYSAAAGCSLPPYHKQGARDAELALHLARHGDYEAAVRVADPADAKLRARLDALRLSVNFPVEWTRLVGLAQQSAQLQLAMGNAQGAAELVAINKQLNRALGPKAAASPLGAALLPTGRRVLALAAAAYRDPARNKTALAQDIELALKQWKNGQTPKPVLPSGSEKGAMSRYLGAPARGRTVTTPDAAAAARTADLLELPLPLEALQAVVGFLDGRDRLADLLFVYRPKLERLYPRPTDLAHHLLDRGLQPGELSRGTGLLSQTFSGGGQKYEIARAISGNAVGAFVRVPAEKAARAGGFAYDPHAFGPVHFDRTFEANRLAVAPEQSGNTLKVQKGPNLAPMVNGLAAPALAAAVLRRERGQDLLGSLALVWPESLNAETLSKLLPTLWSAFGDATLKGEEASGGHFVFRWDGGPMRVKLLVPFDEKSPELVIEDAGGPARLKERAAAARQLDLRERATRFKAGKLDTRLPRALASGSEDLPLEGLKLGMTRAEVEAALPQSRTIRQRTLADGYNLLLLSDPPDTAAYWPRQVFLRFGPDGRLAEVRARFQDGTAQPGSKVPGLVRSLEKAAHAKPVPAKADWAGLWADLAGKDKVEKYRWQDDTTLLTYQHDPGGAEVVLRDRPAEQPDGVTLPPLQFLTTGINGCRLGDTREQVRKALGAFKESGGAEVYRLHSSGPHDAALVWYANGKADRIVVVHRQRPAYDMTSISKALQQVWQGDLDRLGFVRRQDGRRGQVFGRYGWHDDRTRVQSWVQDDAGGLRQFTEWRTWPVADKR
jgi:hypothetical protein